MKVFDFNIHLTRVQRDTERMLADERSLNDEGLTSALQLYSGNIRSSLAGVNFMLFNQDLFFNEGSISSFLKEITKLDFGNTYLSMLFNFRKDGWQEAILNAKAQGVRGIKFHSYDQTILAEDFQKVREVCLFAESQELFICIDTSYGTRKLYGCDNLALAAFLADSIHKAPVILLHSGGARLFDAMLLAADRKNFFLENSFSPVFYQGSSIENDFAFAYRKIGIEKVLYGSDFPYIGMNESINFTINYLEKNRFTEEEIERIIYSNARELMNGV